MQFECLKNFALLAPLFNLTLIAHSFMHVFFRKRQSIQFKARFVTYLKVTVLKKSLKKSLSIGKKSIEKKAFGLTLNMTADSALLQDSKAPKNVMFQFTICKQKAMRKIRNLILFM